MRAPITTVLVLVVLGACRPDQAPRSGEHPEHVASSPDPLRALSPQWVDFHDPLESDAGYNLVLFRRRTPVLMDMDGTVVHAWPDVQVSDRARLLPDGHLAVISLDGQFEVYDWHGRRTWSWQPHEKRHILHHDFVPSGDDRFLLVLRDPATKADYLVEVDRSGDEIWRWDASVFLQDDLSRSRLDHDLTHINSVEVLLPNRWYDSGHEAFEPGNILISARNLDALYVISRATGEVAWRHDAGLEYQHEARMVPRGMAGEGHILFFNNGVHNLAGYRQSAIVELDPAEGRVVWEYRSRGFFSSVEGTQQLLPTGNLLVTSSRGERVFEVTRAGRIVWQWAPPFRPLRASRYPPDYAEPLAALGPASKRPIRRRDPEQHVDADLHEFALVHDSRRVGAGENRTRLLVEPRSCRELHLPGDPELEVGYGMDWARRRRCRRSEGRPARFTVTIRRLDVEEATTLLDQEVDPRDLPVPDRARDPSLLRETIPLTGYAGQRVDLCFTLVGVSRKTPPPCFAWETPKIRSAAEAPPVTPEDPADPGVERLQQERLEALGYIN